MTKMLINFPDDVAERLRVEVSRGDISKFVSQRVERGLDEAKLHSLDDAIAHIAKHDGDILSALERK